ncbi:hypothetical protein Tco_1252723 [Tanacetum coccineum]
MFTLNIHHTGDFTTLTERRHRFADIDWFDLVDCEQFSLHELDGILEDLGYKDAVGKRVVSDSGKGGLLLLEWHGSTKARKDRNKTVGRNRSELEHGSDIVKEKVSQEKFSQEEVMSDLNATLNNVTEKLRQHDIHVARVSGQKDEKETFTELHQGNDVVFKNNDQEEEHVVPVVVQEIDEEVMEREDYIVEENEDEAEAVNGVDESDFHHAETKIPPTKPEVDMNDFHFEFGTRKKVTDRVKVLAVESRSETIGFNCDKKRVRATCIGTVVGYAKGKFGPDKGKKGKGIKVKGVKVKLDNPYAHGPYMSQSAVELSVTFYLPTCVKHLIEVIDRSDGPLTPTATSIFKRACTCPKEKQVNGKGKKATRKEAVTDVEAIKQVNNLEDQVSQ